MNLPRVQGNDWTDASNPCASAGVRNDSTKMSFIYRNSLPSLHFDIRFRLIQRFGPMTRPASRLLQALFASGLRVYLSAIGKSN
jgi:hypothetical protein